MDERGVTFRTKDGNVVTVAGRKTLARFVQHVLPPRFVKMRHYFGAREKWSAFAQQT